MVPFVCLNFYFKCFFCHSCLFAMTPRGPTDVYFQGVVWAFVPFFLSFSFFLSLSLSFFLSVSLSFCHHLCRFFCMVCVLACLSVLVTYLHNRGAQKDRDSFRASKSAWESEPFLFLFLLLWSVRRKNDALCVQQMCFLHVEKSWMTLKKKKHLNILQKKLYLALVTYRQ